MVLGIVGRDAEVASLQAFLGDAGELALHSFSRERPGSGSRRSGTRRSSTRAHTELPLLASRPADADRVLGQAGLTDLFDGVVDDVLSLLLPPRRRALEVALLREEASGDPVYHRTLGVAVRDALQIVGERAPTLIAVDDVQRLGPSSFIMVTQGTLTYYLYDDPTCTPHLVTQGEGLVDDGRRTYGPQRVGQPAQDMSVIIAPTGGAFRGELDAPNPNCGF
jgi:hypothetical protein